MIKGLQALANIQTFNNTLLDIDVRMILNQDGSISVNAEDAAIGFGWFKVEIKNGRKYMSIRWERMNAFSTECGFDHKWSKDDYIPESLFYLLAMKANNDKAKNFQKWIAIDVIPTIRKTGSYTIAKPDSYTITDPVKRAERWIEEEKERQRLVQENQNLLSTNEKLNKNNKNLKKENSDMKPKAKFHDAVARTSVNSEEAISVGKMAGILCQNNGLKIGQNKLFEYLRRQGYLCTADHVWNKPKQNMIDKGYMLYKEGWDKKRKRITFTPLITGKGQILITKKVMNDEEFKKKPSKYYFPILPY